MIPRWALALLALAEVCQWGCTKSQEGPAISAGIDVAACILAHYSDPVPTIVLECGAQSEQDVVRILDGANAMATRKAAGLKAVAP